jgi:hypothetical protein
MRVVRNVLIAIIFSSVLGCKKEKLEVDGVLIRIENASTKIFTSVHVNSGGGENNYSNILPGRTSNYLQYTTAYRYGYIKVIASGKEYVLQPFDYVGETPLEEGNYTYVIDIESEDLTLVFEED